jgi:hypothetical protein
VEITKRVLTVRHSFRILVELFAVFISLSAGQGGLLFDNRYDVPESVRNHSAFEPEWSELISSDNNSLGQAGSLSKIRGHFFSPKHPVSNESLILAQSERWRRA